MTEASLLNGFLLIGVRMTALFMVAPVFGHPAIPVRMRVAFAVGVAGVLAANPLLAQAAGSPELTREGLGGAVLGEVLIGATLGFATRLVFAGFGLLGELVSVQGGLGAATALDPATNASSVALAALFQTFAVLVYLAVDGHHALLHAAASSFDALPLGAGGPDALAFGALARMGGGIFEIAVRIAAPLTAAMLLANLAVGMLGRSIPQLNLMTLQLPAHVGLTLLVLGIGAHAWGEIFASTLLGWSEEVRVLLAGAP